MISMEEVLAAIENRLRRAGAFYAPVAGEPSLGTPHKHVATFLAAYDPSSTPTTVDVDCSTQVPTGTTAIQINMLWISPTVGRRVDIEDTSGNLFLPMFQAVANQYVHGSIIVTLDAALKYRILFENADINTVWSVMTLYWI